MVHPHRHPVAPYESFRRVIHKANSEHEGLLAALRQEVGPQGHLPVLPGFPPDHSRELDQWGKPPQCLDPQSDRPRGPGSPDKPTPFRDRRPDRLRAPGSRHTPRLGASL